MGLSAISTKFVLILCLCCNIIGSKTSTITSKLSECRRCKILTDSFNHWFDKTSRGKFEGGDAAWEETKLKSYSRSEIRLVEIQESLCSELKAHQDPCYVLAEETEQLLEKWWFHEDPSSADLYTWLCIENLKLCCPINHFGEACAPCLKDENNVCGGHGRCDGDGTRKGNGTCLCKKGYTGPLCNDCDINYYLTETGLCEKCHTSCNGCTGKGADDCKVCNLGWQLESGACVDINECLTSACKPSEFCTNTDGSYMCKECDFSCKTCTDEGPSKCSSCVHPSVLWFGTCVNNDLKQNIIYNTYRRLALYIGMLTITLFIFRTSRSITSIIVLIIAGFIFIAERNLNMTTKDVLLHILQSPNE